MAQIGTTPGTMYALVHFWQEKKFSVMRVKDCLPKSVLVPGFDFTSWDPSEEVEVKWMDNCYPARLLQFGEDRKLMDSTIDDLACGKMAVTDLPIIQVLSKRMKPPKEKENFCSKGKKTVPAKKVSDKKDFFLSIRKKLTANKHTLCNNCGNLEGILKTKNLDIERLQDELQNREYSLQESKEKYKEMKRKYKAKKKEIKEITERKEPQEGKKFGSLIIPKQKLSLCRDNDYSKHVGDLLDICFGREVLSESVLKCPNKRTLKTNVLEQDVINDIICHTIEKFTSVNVAMVRAAIRQKLNTCHKAKNKK